MLPVPATVRSDAEVVTAAVAAPTRDITERESRHAMDLLFAGKVQSALAYLETMAPECQGEPLFLLTRARLYRELLPVDDEKKEGVKEFAVVMYADLDSVVAVCTRRMKSGDENPRLLLYRGRARMFKSHVRTYERAFWQHSSV